LTHEPPLPAEKSDLAAEVHSDGSSNQLETLKEPFQNNNKDPVNPVTSSSLSDGPYSASLRMFKTVTNDSKLFIAACSAGLVRILVRNLEKELRQDLLEMYFEGISAPSLWWTGSTSGIDVWCDTCLKLLGAKPLYGKYRLTALSSFLQKENN
jgi:hypothetical protein